MRRSVKCVNSSNHGVSNKEIINLASVFVADIFIYPIYIFLLRRLAVMRDGPLAADTSEWSSALSVWEEVRS